MLDLKKQHEITIVVAIVESFLAPGAHFENKMAAKVAEKLFDT